VNEKKIGIGRLSAGTDYRPIPMVLQADRPIPIIGKMADNRPMPIATDLSVHLY
jgi:hypothetical protein